MIGTRRTLAQIGQHYQVGWRAGDRDHYPMRQCKCGRWYRPVPFSLHCLTRNLQAWAVERRASLEFRYPRLRKPRPPRVDVKRVHIGYKGPERRVEK